MIDHDELLKHNLTILPQVEAVIDQQKETLRQRLEILNGVSPSQGFMDRLFIQKRRLSIKLIHNKDKDNGPQN